MDIQNWKPLTELASVRERIEKLAGASAWIPLADWYETDDELILVLDVPGIDASSVEVTHDGQNITIAGTRVVQHYGEVKVSERPKGSFQRTLNVPESVEVGSGVAQYGAGQLEVRFSKTNRTINVEIG